MKLNKEDLPPTDGEWADCADGWFSFIDLPKNKDCVYHNSLGPAVIHDDGEKAWFFDGELHRLDGPAIECPDGTKYWYIDGKKVSKKDFPSAVISFLLGVDRETTKIIERELKK